MADDSAVPARVAALPWVWESSRGKMRAMSIGLTAVGALFLWLTRGALDGGDTNLLAAFGLGVLLSGIGALGLIFDSGQRVRSEPRERAVVVEKLGRFGTRARRIPFGAIDRVWAASHFDGDIGTRWYAVIELKSGERIQLMDRSADAADIQRLCNELAASIGVPAERA